MPSSRAMRRCDQPRWRRDRMVSIMATLSRLDMAALVEYERYSQGYLPDLRLLKVAGFQAPIGGWFWAPADKPGIGTKPRRPSSGAASGGGGGSASASGVIESEARSRRRGSRSPEGGDVVMATSEANDPLAYLGRVVNGHDLDRFKEQGKIAALTDRDPKRSLEYRLRFENRPADREGLLDLLPVLSANRDRRKALLDSPFLRQVEFFFRSATGAPHLLHLRKTRVLAEDGLWAVIQRMKQHDNERTSNPTSQVTSFFRGAEHFSLTGVNKEVIDVGSNTSFREDCPIGYNQLSNLSAANPPSFWIQGRLAG